MATRTRTPPSKTKTKSAAGSTPAAVAAVAKLDLQGALFDHGRVGPYLLARAFTDKRGMRLIDPRKNPPTWIEWPGIEATVLQRPGGLRVSFQSERQLGERFVWECDEKTIAQRFRADKAYPDAGGYPYVFRVAGNVFAMSRAEPESKNEKVPLEIWDGKKFIRSDLPTTARLPAAFDTTVPPVADRATLGDGTEVLLWDGSGWELTKALKWSRTLSLDTKTPGSPFSELHSPVPATHDGFYFIRDGLAWLARRGRDPSRVFAWAPTLLSMAPGPDGAVLLRPVTNNKRHWAAVVAFPDESCIPLSRSEIGATHRNELMSQLYWCEESQIFFAVGWGLAVLDGPTVLARPRSKPRASAAK